MDNFEQKLLIARYEQILRKLFQIQNSPNPFLNELLLSQFSRLCFDLLFVSFLNEPAMQEDIDMEDDKNTREYHNCKVKQKYLKPTCLLIEIEHVQIKQVSQKYGDIWEDSYYLRTHIQYYNKEFFNQQILQNTMLTSTKTDFRINLKKYSSIKPIRSTRKTLQLNFSYFQPLKTISKNESQINSSMRDHVAEERVDKIFVKTLQLYDRNLQFYRLNEQKLSKAIERQLRQRNYMYKRKIMNSVNSRQKIQMGQVVNYEKLEQELEMLNKFLEQLYEKKRIKQIFIVHNNMKDEQNAIIDKIDHEELQFFHQNLECMESGLITDYIYEYQNICMKFGAAEPNLMPHIHIRNQINNSKDDIKNYFQGKVKQKAKYFYLHKKRYA